MSRPRQAPFRDVRRAVNRSRWYVVGTALGRGHAPPQTDPTRLRARSLAAWAHRPRDGAR